MFFRKKFRQKELNLVISVGAGINQLPLIREAHDLGYHVIGIDQNTNAPGLLESDIKIQESVSDYEEIYLKIRELLIDGKIKAVLTRSYGDAVKTCSYLSEKLDIPFIPFDRIDDILNKKKMKVLFKKNDILSPAYNHYSAKRKRAYTYPCVVKPVKGHAKSGVQLLKSEDELKKYIKNVNPEEETDLLIEDYIPGDEIIAIGLVNSGKFNLYVISDKETTDIPYFADLKHSAPSKYYDRWEEISQIGQKISEIFAIINSPLLIEMRITNDGEIYVLETAAEFGGEFISDIMIPNLINTSIMKNCIKTISENVKQTQNFKRTQNSVVIKYIPGKTGYFKSFSPINLPEYKNNIIFYKIFKDIGAKLQSTKTNHDRIGVIAVKARSMKLASSIADKAFAALNITISTKKG